MNNGFLMMACENKAETKHTKGKAGTLIGISNQTLDGEEMVPSHFFCDDLKECDCYGIVMYYVFPHTTQCLGYILANLTS